MIFILAILLLYFAATGDYGHPAKATDVFIAGAYLLAGLGMATDRICKAIKQGKAA